MHCCRQCFACPNAAQQWKFWRGRRSQWRWNQVRHCVCDRILALHWSGYLCLHMVITFARLFCTFTPSSPASSRRLAVGHPGGSATGLVHIFACTPGSGCVYSFEGLGASFASGSRAGNAGTYVIHLVSFSDAPRLFQAKRCDRFQEGKEYSCAWMSL